MKAPYFAMLWNSVLLLPRLVVASLRWWVGQRLGRPAARLQRLIGIDWLAATLGLDPRLIGSACIEEIHTGTATRSRLQIRYSDSQAPTPGPTSLFIKSTPPDFGAALFGALFKLGGNEVAFYQELRSGIPVRTPRVYSCEGDSTSYAMLLEDLTTQGCTFRTLAEECSREEARRIVTTLAQLHAHFWQSPRFATDLAWVNRFETNRDFRLLNLVRQVSIPIACRKFAEVIPREIREVVPQLMNNYRRLEEHWAQGPRTLLHGDAHLGNMYFQDGQAGLLDWQVTQYGQGMRDISYFLINSMQEELRRSHQEELIQHYLATLQDRGVSLDFGTAWRQYRLQSVYAWIAGVVTAPSNFQAEDVVVAGLSRSCRAILDLDAISLLREL
jgi:aminoglycoside phosphotransferase (APT) family kinase protein